MAPMRGLNTLSLANRRSTELPADCETDAGLKRTREDEPCMRNMSSRHGAGKSAAGPLKVAEEGPLAADKQVYPRDRDIGVRITTPYLRTSRAVAGARHPHTPARQHNRQTETVGHEGPLELQTQAGGEDAQNLSGNRFGGSETCKECSMPHTDSNYVATDANGVSICGNCWDAALGATIVAQCAFPPGDHTCVCGTDLRTEEWFAVDSTPMERAYCQECCVNFWGLTDKDMVVSTITDGRMAHRGQLGGAHLPSGMQTPNDDTSQRAGLSDRGFSTGLAPTLLEGCMNLRPLQGEPKPYYLLHECGAHEDARPGEPRSNTSSPPSPDTHLHDA